MVWWSFGLVIYTACLTLGRPVHGQTPTSSTSDQTLQKLEDVLTKLEAVRLTQEELRQELVDLKSSQGDLVKLQEDQETVKQDQTDLKNHVLPRLDALDEKTAWCLSNGQKGAHPLNDRMRKIEQQQEQQNVTLTWIKDFLRGPQDCQQIYERGLTSSGVYTISLNGFIKMDVYCEQELDGGGWTVFQRRQDGSVDFFRNWADYKTGFGDLSGEFWLGNDNIHLLTKEHDQKLKVELTYKDETAYADYSTFWVENENLKYKLTVSGFSVANPPGDSLAWHNGCNFSTKDRDNDKWPHHCAQTYTGAWWYRGCLHSNLNGVWGSTEHAKGVNWHHWKGLYVPLTGTRMMIKRKA